LNKGEKLVFLGFHAPGFLFADILMVKTGQMEDTVDEKEIYFTLRANTPFPGIPEGRIGRNNHVSQEKRVQTFSLTFLHGKGDYICRPIPSQIRAVHLPDFAIIHQNNRKKSVRRAQDA
jgi:hypothetical protein